LSTTERLWAWAAWVVLAVVIWVTPPVLNPEALAAPQSAFQLLYPSITAAELLPVAVAVVVAAHRVARAVCLAEAVVVAVAALV
jgi:hypothetical protein